MTREEMIKIIGDECNRRRRCSVCPLCDVDNCFADTMTDEELARAVEIITKAECSEKAVKPDHTPAQVDEEVPQVKRMTAVDRDEMCAMKGKLLMLSCCVGVTITSAMADELLFIAETIDNALSKSGEDAK